MKRIVLFDTSVASSNLGDQIIMDAARKVLAKSFPDAFFLSIQTHDSISRASYKLLQGSQLAIICGTNLLSSNMNIYNQWKVNLFDTAFVKGVILLGVGWWQYQPSPNLYTRLLLKRLLANRRLHSVRDDYTKKQLEAVGITNVVNTACPTMWSLTPEHCRTITSTKAASVVVTLTEYNQKPEFDKPFVQLLRKLYNRIYFWPQQPGDFSYMKLIADHDVHFVPPTIDALDRVLEEEDVDYVGTRLHAGIRALQKRKRSLILAVDNRAKEIAADTNLPVLPREDLSSIESRLTGPIVPDIRLPTAAIQRWTKQITAEIETVT